MNNYGNDIQVILADAPADKNGQALSGDRINMTEWQKCFITVAKAVGTDGDDPVLAVKQHTAATSGTSKALQTTTAYTRLGADVTAITADTVVTQAAADTLTIADSAQKEGTIVIEVDVSQLDNDNGYTHVSLDFASPGSNAQIISVAYVLQGKRYKGVATNSQA